MSLPSSREPAELLELGRTFFEKCLLPLLPFLGEIEEQGGIARELLEARLAIAIRVEGGLEAAQRHGAELQHLATPSHRLHLELGQRDHGIDETHFQRLLRVVLAAQE